MLVPINEERTKINGIKKKKNCEISDHRDIIVNFRRHRCIAFFLISDIHNKHQWDISTISFIRYQLPKLPSIPETLQFHQKNEESKEAESEEVKRKVTETLPFGRPIRSDFRARDPVVVGLDAVVDHRSCLLLSSEMQ